MVEFTQKNGLGSAFQNLVRATASVTGHEFFRVLARELAQTLGFKYALVSEVTDLREERAKVLAFWSDGRHEKSFEYYLKETPCEAVSSGQLCFYRQGVVAEFPGDRHLSEMRAEAYLGVPLRDAGGRPIGILAALHDAPVDEIEGALEIFQIFAVRAGVELERLRMQTMLSESERRFRSLLENGTDLILTLDRDGRIQYASPSCARVSGYAPEEVVGRLAFDFIQPDDRATMLELLGQAIDRPNPGPLFETRLLRRDGTWIDIESRANQISLDPHTLGLVINCRDVSERKRHMEAQALLEERVCHAQRLESIGVVSAGIAHEFKNILGPILGNAELARMDLAPEHPSRRWLNQIIKSTVAARDLVQQILTFSRQAPSVKRVVSLGDVVTDAVRMLRVAIPKSVVITRQIALGLPPVVVDSNQIHQVIMNLGINAWQAMPKGQGQISVSLDMGKTACGDMLRIAMTDDGKGMDSETLSRLFEPFFTTKAPGDGTGLGLPVVHGIVTSHNGTIDVTSSPGAGTTFEIFLPVAFDSQTES